jgi:hypothetical protein
LSPFVRADPDDLAGALGRLHEGTRLGTPLRLAVPATLLVEALLAGSLGGLGAGRQGADCRSEGCRVTSDRTPFLQTLVVGHFVRNRRQYMPFCKLSPLSA